MPHGVTWHHNNNEMPRPLRTREDYSSWLADWKRTELPLLASFLHPELVEQFIHTAYDDYWRTLTRERAILTLMFHLSRKWLVRPLRSLDFSEFQWDQRARSL